MQVSNRQCGERIELNGGKACTYCMRPANHTTYDPEGKHEIHKTSADMKAIDEANRLELKPCCQHCQLWRVIEKEGSVGMPQTTARAGWGECYFRNLQLVRIKGSLETYKSFYCGAYKCAENAK